MNTNEEYWSDFYANSNELPLESSNFAVYILKFLQNSLEKKSNKIFLVSVVVTEEMLIFLGHTATKSLALIRTPKLKLISFNS